MCRLHYAVHIHAQQRAVARGGERFLAMLQDLQHGQAVNDDLPHDIDGRR